jgi:hypothetical protein
MTITLSAAEREKFAAWLEQDLESSKILVNQLKKLGTGGEAVAKNRKQEMMAELIVCRRLRSIEDMTIGGDQL